MTPAPMELALHSRRVTRVLLDFDLSIEFTGGATVAFSEFVIGDVLVDEDNQFEGLRLAAALVGRLCESVAYAESGELTIVFDDGTVVEAASREEVESWEYTGSDGSTVVCLAGGDIEVLSGPSDPPAPIPAVTALPSVGATVVRIAVGDESTVEFSDRTSVPEAVSLDEAYLVLRESVAEVSEQQIELSSGVVIAVPQ